MGPPTKYYTSQVCKNDGPNTSLIGEANVAHLSDTASSSVANANEVQCKSKTIEKDNIETTKATNIKGYTSQSEEGGMYTDNSLLVREKVCRLPMQVQKAQFASILMAPSILTPDESRRPLRSKERKEINRNKQLEFTERKADADSAFFWSCFKRFNNIDLCNNNSYINKANDFKTNDTISNKHTKYNDWEAFAQRAEEVDPWSIYESPQEPIQYSQKEEVVTAWLNKPPDSDSTEEDINSSEFERFSELFPKECLIQENLQNMKLEKPSPFQSKVIPLAFAGKDLMCLTLLGSGKTIAYLIPMLSNLLTKIETKSKTKKSSCEVSPEKNEANEINGIFPKAMIILPTRESALQVLTIIRCLCFSIEGLRAVSVFGGSEIRPQLAELARGCDILVGTPGRIGDLYDRKILFFRDIEFLSLDEMERLLSMGFQQKLRGIISESDMPTRTRRQTMLLSTPLCSNTQEVMELAQSLLKPKFATVSSDSKLAIRKDITHVVINAPAELTERARLLFAILCTNSSTRTLVFVKCKMVANWICTSLIYDHGIPADQIHGNYTQTQRSIAIRRFKEGKIRFLVSTNEASRGLNLPVSEHVVQFDMPTVPADFDSYIYRLGRTAANGKVTCFFVPGVSGNGRICKQLLELLIEYKQDIPRWLLELDNPTLPSHTTVPSKGSADKAGNSRSSSSRVPMDTRNHQVIEDNVPGAGMLYTNFNRLSDSIASNSSPSIYNPYTCRTYGLQGNMTPASVHLGSNHHHFQGTYYPQIVHMHSPHLFQQTGHLSGRYCPSFMSQAELASAQVGGEEMAFSRGGGVALHGWPPVFSVHQSEHWSYHQANPSNIINYSQLHSNESQYQFNHQQYLMANEGPHAEPMIHYRAPYDSYNIGNGENGCKNRSNNYKSKKSNIGATNNNSNKGYRSNPCKALGTATKIE